MIASSDLLTAERTQKHFEEQRCPIYAVPTPLSSWNKVCRDAGGGVGLPRGWLVTVAAATGTGKSLFALNIAAEAVRNSERVGIVSLEMSASQLYGRYLSIVTGEDIRGLERGPDHDENAALRAEEAIAEQRGKGCGALHVNEGHLGTIDEALDLVHEWYEHENVRFFVLDYLQLIASRDMDTLSARVAEASGALREFAKTSHSTVIALSQLNRSASANRQESPIAQGLMGSSSIENDSDQVILLDHSRSQYDKISRTAKTWALLVKNRHGAQGDIPVEWDYKTLRIREAMDDELDRWPGVNR